MENLLLVIYLLFFLERNQTLEQLLPVVEALLVEKNPVSPDVNSGLEETTAKQFKTFEDYSVLLQSSKKKKKVKPRHKKTTSFIRKNKVKASQWRSRATPNKNIYKNINTRVSNKNKMTQLKTASKTINKNSKRQRSVSGIRKEMDLSRERSFTRKERDKLQYENKKLLFQYKDLEIQHKKLLEVLKSEREQSNEEIAKKNNHIENLIRELQLTKQISEEFIHFDTRDLDDEDLRNLKVAVDCECQRRKLDCGRIVNIPDVRYLPEEKDAKTQLKRNSTIKELEEEYIYDSFDSPLRSLGSSSVRLKDSSRKKQKSNES